MAGIGCSSSSLGSVMLQTRLPPFGISPVGTPDEDADCEGSSPGISVIAGAIVVLSLGLNDWLPIGGVSAVGTAVSCVEEEGLQSATGAIAGIIVVGLVKLEDWLPIVWSIVLYAGVEYD